MARYKHIDTSARFLAVDLHRQLLPGTFEHGLNHLLDHELDLTGFDTSFRNDETGAAAYVRFWHKPAVHLSRKQAFNLMTERQRNRWRIWIRNR